MYTIKGTSVGISSPPLLDAAYPPAQSLPLLAAKILFGHVIYWSDPARTQSGRVSQCIHPCRKKYIHDDDDNNTNNYKINKKSFNKNSDRNLILINKEYTPVIWHRYIRVLILFFKLCILFSQVL